MNECINYTAAEVATLTGLNVKSVYDGVRSGDIPGRKVGRRYLFPKPLIDRWLGLDLGVAGENSSADDGITHSSDPDTPHGIPCWDNKRGLS